MFNKIMGIFLSILAMNSYGFCYGYGSSDSRVRTSRDQLSFALKSTKNLKSLNVPDVIALADRCIAACNSAMTNNEVGASQPGVSQIRGQVVFLKSFLKTLQEVQNLKEGQDLSEKSKKVLLNGDRVCKGIVGHLVTEANKKIRKGQGE